MSITADKKDGKLTGRFRVEVQHGGLRKRGRFNTLKEAEAAEGVFKAELVAGVDTGAKRKFTKDRSRPQTLLEAVRRASGLLWVGKAVEVENFNKLYTIAAIIGEGRAVNSITTETLDDLVVGLSQRGIADATYNRYFSAFNVFLRWCKERNYLEGEVPTFTWRDEDEGRIRWLSYGEENEVLRLIRGGMDRLVRVAINTGMRRAELLGLTPGQVQPDMVHLWKTKNGTARHIPITSETFRDLSILLQRGMPSASQLRYEWNLVRDAMGLGDDGEFVFHACRHTFATRHVEANTNLRVLQTLMGHKRIETTMRYAHVTGDTLRDAVLAAQTFHSQGMIAHGSIRGHNKQGLAQVGEGSYRPLLHFTPCNTSHM